MAEAAPTGVATEAGRAAIVRIAGHVAGKKRRRRPAAEQPGNGFPETGHHFPHRLASAPSRLMPVPMACWVEEGPVLGEVVVTVGPPWPLRNPK